MSAGRGSPCPALPHLRSEPHRARKRASTRPDQGGAPCLAFEAWDFTNLPNPSKPTHKKGRPILPHLERVGRPRPSPEFFPDAASRGEWSKLHGKSPLQAASLVPCGLLFADCSSAHSCRVCCASRALWPLTPPPSPKSTPS